jgi:hypothetical protein
MPKEPIMATKETSKPKMVRELRQLRSADRAKRAAEFRRCGR